MRASEPHEGGPSCSRTLLRNCPSGQSPRAASFSFVLRACSRWRLGWASSEYHVPRYSPGLYLVTTSLVAQRANSVAQKARSASCLGSRMCEKAVCPDSCPTIRLWKVRPWTSADQRRYRKLYSGKRPKTSASCSREPGPPKSENHGGTRPFLFFLRRWYSSSVCFRLSLARTDFSPSMFGRARS